MSSSPPSQHEEAPPEAGPARPDLFMAVVVLVTGLGTSWMTARKGEHAEDATPSDQDFWALLRDSAAANPPTALQSSPTAKQEVKAKLPKSAFARVRDLLVGALVEFTALSVWTYSFLKLFVLDIDRVILGRFLPSAMWLADFRFLVLLFIAGTVGVFFWRLRMVLVLLYIAFYPFIVVFWRIPQAIRRMRLHRNWTLWIVALQTTLAGARNLRFLLVASTLGPLAAVVTLLSSNPYLLGVAGVTMMSLLLATAVGVARASLRRSWFMRAQRTALDTLATFTTKAVVRWRADVQARRPGELLTQQQVQEVAMSIWTGAIANRALYFWADKLEQYQRSSVTLVMNFTWYVALFLLSVFTLGLVNLALLKVEPAQFTFETSPSALAMLLFALSSLFPGQGGGIAPARDWAYALQLFAGIYGPVFLGAFFLSTVVTVMGARQDVELRATVAELRARARVQEADLTTALRMGIDEALGRLRVMGFTGVQALYEYLRTTIPHDSTADEPRLDHVEG